MFSRALPLPRVLSVIFLIAGGMVCSFLSGIQSTFVLDEVSRAYGLAGNPALTGPQSVVVFIARCMKFRSTVYVWSLVGYFPVYAVAIYRP